MLDFVFRIPIIVDVLRSVRDSFVGVLEKFVNLFRGPLELVSNPK